MIAENKDVVRLKHILDAANKIISYYKIYLETGEKTDLLSEAIERNLIIIGEASRCLSEEFKSSNTQIPWHSIIGFRHILVHEYHRIDQDILWDVTGQKIPELIDDIEVILKNHNEA